MKVWWVYAWYDYYPNSDNFISSFATEEEANEFAEKYKAETNYDFVEVKDISDRLNNDEDESDW